MTSSNKQFFDFMNPASYIDFIQQVGRPADMSLVNEAIRSNAEIMTAMSTALLENWQIMSQKSFELLQNNIAQVCGAMKEAVTAENLEQTLECQNKHTKAVAENVIDNTKEIMHEVAKSSAKIFDTINASIADKLQQNTNKTKGGV